MAIGANQPASTPAVRTVRSQLSAGYVGNVSSGSLMGAAARFNLPTIRCNLSDGNFQWFSLLVGVSNSTGGLHNGILVFAACVPGYDTPTYTLQAELWTDPGFSNMSLAVKAGDSLQVMIQTKSSTGSDVIRVTDLTTGKSASRSGIGMASDTSAWMYITHYNGTDLASFTPVNFTNCAVVRAGALVPLSKVPLLTRFVMADAAGKTMAYTSPLYSGTRFSVTFARPS